MMTLTTNRRTPAGPWAGLALFSFAFLLISFTTDASAMKIQNITSSKGVNAWLVEEHSIPLISIRFAFVGGATQDPAGKEGRAYFVSGMLDEGAGKMTSLAFQEQLEELAIRLNFDASRDYFTGSLQTLTKNRKAAVRLLKLALGAPRFDKDAVDRIRAQIKTGLKFDAKDPSKVASREWFKLAFAGHPYGRPVKGTQDSLDALKREDLVTYAKAVLARKNLTVAVVGDITAAELNELLDEVFGDLPETPTLTKIAEAKPPRGPLKKVIEMNVPQSVAQFGHGAIARNDKDFIPAYIINYILGGGGFNSRLTEEVREKRGLAYSVYSYLHAMKYGSIYKGGVATKNKSIGKSLEIIRLELARMAADGPSEEEFANARKYLTGSYGLRFDSSAKIARQLLWIQIDDLGIDYINKRNSLIEAVTMADIRRVAKRLLKADNLIITIVGKPDGFAADTPAKQPDKG